MGKTDGRVSYADDPNLEINALDNSTNPPSPPPKKRLFGRQRLSFPHFSHDKSDIWVFTPTHMYLSIRHIKEICPKLLIYFIHEYAWFRLSSYL